MEKPRKIKIGETLDKTGHIGTLEQYEIYGYNRACDEWQKYFDWYIKEHCVKKEKKYIDVVKRWLEAFNYRVLMKVGNEKDKQFLLDLVRDADQLVKEWRITDEE